MDRGERLRKFQCWLHNRRVQANMSTTKSDAWRFLCIRISDKTALASKWAWSNGAEKSENLHASFTKCLEDAKQNGFSNSHVPPGKSVLDLIEETDLYNFRLR